MTWRPDMVEAAHSLRRRGLSLSAIARAVGTSRQAVQGRLSRDAAKARVSAPETPARRRLAQFDPILRRQ